MSIEQELASLMYEQCTKYYKDGIFVKADGGWTQYDTEDSFKASMKADSIVDWFIDCVKKDRKYVYAYPRHSIYTLVEERIGYPWTTNIGTMFYACYKGSITINDVYRYISLVENNYEKIQEIIDENAEEHFGSNKFKHCLNIYAEKLENFLSSVNRNIFVENVSIQEPTNKDNRFTYTFTFNKHLTYQQRKAFDRALCSYFINYYSKILEKAKVRVYYQISNLYFSWSETKKCSPCKSYSFTVGSNNFLGIGVDPDAQFMPIMKKLGGKN